MTPLEREIKTFADGRWPDRTMPGRLRKLGEEFGELAEAMALHDPQTVISEAADCAIVLSDLVAMFNGPGGQPFSLQRAMEEKLKIVKQRPVKSKEGK